MKLIAFATIGTAALLSAPAFNDTYCVLPPSVVKHHSASALTSLLASCACLSSYRW